MKHLSPRLELQQKLSRQIHNALQGDVVEQIIAEATQSDDDSYWRSIMEGHSFKVEPHLMEKQYTMFQDVRKKLGITEDIDFYISGDSDVNAFSVAAEKKGAPHIVNINSALFNLMTDDELRFVVGHEIGHLINHDTRLHRLINFIFPCTAAMPTALNHKVRLEEQLAELVADRYGFLAVGKLEPCVSAFYKMASGLDITKMQIEMNVLLEENRKHLDYFLNDKGISNQTHPVNPIRIESLALFAQAKTKKELDAQMKPLIDILLRLGSSPVDRYISNFIATAGLIVASADESIGRDEINVIINNLADTEMFPTAYLQEIASGDVSAIFQEAVTKVLEEEPSLREAMFHYMIDIVMSDHSITKKEIDLLYEIGQSCFNYGRKETAQMLAEMIQAKYVPNVVDLG